MPKYLAVLAALGAAGAFAQDTPTSTESRTVATGSAWTIGETTHLGRLVVEEGAALAAPDGYDLTLTVDGVSTAIRSGDYGGDIVLTPTKSYLVEGMGAPEPYHFRSAVLVNDGKYVSEQSVPAAAGAAEIGDEVATNVTVTSREENFNGIVVTGDSVYTINHARLNLTGNGGNDFAGYGAAIMSSGNALVTVNDAHIRARGAVRTAIFTGGKSTMFVNDSDIEVFSGTLPEGYEFSIMPGRMMEVPYGLGLTGNVRATNLIDEATVYYTNTRIKSHGWGALSSDGNGPTRMFVKNCLIETEGSGYGAYSNGDAHDHFSGSTFNVADVGVIVGGNGWVTFTDGTVVNSGKLGVMMHQGTGGSKLTVEKKSRINSTNTAVQIKGRGADILVDDAILDPGNGILIQTMENDDPIMKAMAMGGPGGPPPAGPGGPPPGGPGGPPPGGMPGAEAAGFSPDVHATIRNTQLEGDVIHALTSQSDMTVTLQAATLSGAISTGTALPASGEAPSRETFRTVGEVTNMLGPSTTEHGLKVYLDWTSRWTVSRTSYLDGLVIADGAEVAAPAGARLSMSVDGVQTPIRPGAYDGAIVLEVSSGN